MRLFSKDVEEYTREDFLDGTEPYDYLYLYINDTFQLGRIKQKIDAVARKCGVKNFPKLFSDYCVGRGVNVGDCNVTDFPTQPLTLRCGNYICNQGGVRTDTEVICPHPITPVERLVNIDTGIEKVKIAYSRNRGWRTAIFDRKTISTANQIVNLADIGISVTSESAKLLVKYFAKLEELNQQIIPETECITRLGWITDGDSPLFSPYVDKLAFDGEASHKAQFDNIHSKGDIEAWFAFISKNIRKNNVIARVVFAAALASVLVKPLGCLPFFIHLWGGSGSGKSVLAMCAASIWGDPLIGHYIQTMNSTFVGMERTVAFYNSLPFILDELQIVGDKKDFENIIYMLTEGAGRMRGNKSGGIDITPTWRNCIITTGEKPILVRHSGGGSVNRVIEVECKSKFFDKSKGFDEGNDAVNFLKDNYGMLGKAFIAMLLRDGFDGAKRLFKGYFDELTADYEITQKQAQSAALILTADKLVADLVFADGCNLTTKELSEFLKTDAAVSVCPRAYEYVCEVVAANQNKFGGNGEFNEIWGVMGDDCVYILKNKFALICEEGGFDSRQLLSWLADRKLIKRNGKHYDCPKRIGGANVRCVYMSLPRCGDGVCEDF